jgi:hypothetical protein
VKPGFVSKDVVVSHLNYFETIGKVVHCYFIQPCLKDVLVHILKDFPHCCDKLVKSV